MAVLSLAAFVGIWARLYVVQIRRHHKYANLAASQHGKRISLNRRRGDILDCKGQILATSTLYDTISFNPAVLKGKELPPQTADRLARLLNLPTAKVAAMLDRNKVSILARKVEPEISDAVRLLADELVIPDGVIFSVKESKRLYPQGDLAGPIIGYTKIDDTGDNIGQEGLELRFDSNLRGENKETRVPVNSWREGLAPVDERLLKATLGANVVLTLDSQIQHYTQKALRKRVGEVQAQAGAALVMDVKTGAILAMATCPDFDPNEFSRSESDQRRNRILTDPIEIGSVMKILTYTILMDNGLLSPDENVNCEGGFAYVAGRPITDTHKLDVVPFRIAFADSSNIAAAKLGLRLEPNLYYNSLKKFGVGDRLGVDLPGENSGLLRPVDQWTPLSRTSLPMGYETSMTALQVICALSAVGNEGMRMRPRIVEKIVSADGLALKEFPPTEAGRAAQAETCRTIVKLMESVVEEGTGTAAKIPGYSVAGKTGTTKKHKEGKHYIASFAGLLPASEPRVAIYVYVDEPNPKIEYYGGKISAPIFADIAENVVRILGIPPDRPDELTAKSATPDGAQANARLVSLPVGDPTSRPYPLLDETVEGEEGSDSDGKPNREIALSLSSRTIKLKAIDTKGKANAIPSATSDGRGVPTGRPLGQKEAVIYAKTLRDQALPSLGMSLDELKPGVMPYCVGLTMPEVARALSRAEISFKMTGSGVAIRQSPAAWSPVENGAQALIEFGLPSQPVREHNDGTTRTLLATAGFQPSR